MQMLSKGRAEEVKNKVSIPDYFDRVILPQMGSYYDLYPVDFESKPVVCCPIHDEDTPSFRYYPETKSFYCFGCQKGGNIINLHRYFMESVTGTKPEYEETVDYLFNAFIKNADIVLPNIQTGNMKEKKSNDKELLAYNMYRVDMENSITADKEMAETTKLKIYEMMDTIDALIGKDVVNAIEGKTWLQHYITDRLAKDKEQVAVVV